MPRRRRQDGRYTVDGVDGSYDDPGPALSRALTEAIRTRGVDRTVYARDLDGSIIGYAESYADPSVVATVRRL